MLHGGVYHLARRDIGYRNDYCRRCAAPRLAIRRRTFDVLHVWWVPLLPLGYWKRWRCAVCDSNPHEAVTTRPAFRWAGALIVLLLVVVAWMHQIDAADREDAWFAWIMRIGGPVGFILALRAALHPPPLPDLERLLASVPPNRDPNCPLCKGPVVPALPRWRCTRCGAERFGLGEP
jgi:hypothetical protein